MYVTVCVYMWLTVWVCVCVCLGPRYIILYIDVHTYEEYIVFICICVVRRAYVFNVFNDTIMNVFHHEEILLLRALVDLNVLAILCYTGIEYYSFIPNLLYPTFSSFFFCISFLILFSRLFPQRPVQQFFCAVFFSFSQACAFRIFALHINIARFVRFKIHFFPHPVLREWKLSANFKCNS